MKKIIKSGIFFVLAYFLISAVSYAAETEATKEKEQPAEAEIEEQAIAPAIKDLPAAPTLKDLAEKQKADEEVFKKLVEAPVSGPHDEFNRSTPRSSLISLSVAVRKKL